MSSRGALLPINDGDESPRTNIEPPRNGVTYEACSVEGVPLVFSAPPWLVERDGVVVETVASAFGDSGNVNGNTDIVAMSDCAIVSSGGGGFMSLQRSGMDVVSLCTYRRDERYLTRPR